MFSIIIPAYNEEKYIEQTLQSIHEQTEKDYEIIVVANGCTDKTTHIAGKHCTVIELHQPNVSIARNTGAAHAKGDILLFLDADTRLSPNALEIVKRDFTQKDTVATFISRPNHQRLSYSTLLALKNFFHRTGIHPGASGTLVTRRDLFHRVGGFDKQLRLNEDDILIQALTKHGRYKVLNAHATTSMRRYEKWGLVKLGLFWLSHKTVVYRNGEYEAVR